MSKYTLQLLTGIIVHPHQFKWETVNILNREPKHAQKNYISQDSLSKEFNYYMFKIYLFIYL